MKLAKKLIGVALAAAVVMSAGAMVASANNHYDESFSFTFQGKEDYTKGRLKDDDSSMYIKVNSGGAFVAAAYGRNSETGTLYPAYKSSNGTSYTKTCYVGQSYYLYNYVHENGYKYGSIQGAPLNPTQWYTATGVWSPDSV